MAGDSADTASTVLDHQVSSLTDRPSRVDDVVYEDHILALDLTDDGHLGDFVGLGSALVTDHHGYPEELRVGVGTLGTTDVRRSDDRIL